MACVNDPYDNMGSVFAEDASNTVFLPKTPHIVGLYILSPVWEKDENNRHYLRIIRSLRRYLIILVYMSLKERGLRLK